MATRHTLGEKEKAKQENLKSVILDRCKWEQHITDWRNTTIITSETRKYQRWIKEAIEIRKRGAKIINRDEGAFLLPHTLDSLLHLAMEDVASGQTM